MDVTAILRRLFIFIILTTSLVAETIYSIVAFSEIFYTQNVKQELIIETKDAYNSLECLNECQVTNGCKGIAFKKPQCNFLNNSAEVLLGNDNDAYTFIPIYFSYLCEQVSKSMHLITIRS